MGRVDRISLPTATAEVDEESCSKASLAEKGHFVIYTFDQKRFMIPLAYLSNVIFRELLKLSEEEFGLYEPITLPCNAVFMTCIVSLIKRRTTKGLDNAFLDSIILILTKSENFIGKGYSCDGMVKLCIVDNDINKNVSNSAYMVASNSVTLWHSRLAYIVMSIPDRLYDVHIDCGFGNHVFCCSDFKGGDHLWLAYFSKNTLYRNEDGEYNCGKGVTARFDTRGYKSDNLVRRCGIHPVYKQDVEYLEELSARDGAITMPSTLQGSRFRNCIHCIKKEINANYSEDSSMEEDKDIKGILKFEEEITPLKLTGKSFSVMRNLRLLIINDVDVHLSKDLEYLSNELRFLKWHGYPLKSLPSSF
ncbi:hypothetical protein LWI28_001482 [Acer negundo]|uniref:Uncharacterized protein n=1 Tax=Acer negundo TaxID=4023 RepID=A0AAD5IWY0_ACENE|nr:hypothetical protein LWI28_001482 [Acer negundo]